VMNSELMTIPPLTFIFWKARAKYQSALLIPVSSGHEVFFALTIDRKQVFITLCCNFKHSARTMGDKGRMNLQLSIHVPGTSLLRRLANVFCRRMGTCRRVVPYVSEVHMVAALWLLYRPSV
jgi:hypothetical protein